MRSPGHVVPRGANRTPAANRAASDEQPRRHALLVAGAPRQSGLLVHRPTAATARTRQNLDTSKGALRVVISVKHKHSSKPVASTKETTSGRRFKQGRQSSAYCGAVT